MGDSSESGPGAGTTGGQGAGGDSLEDAARDEREVGRRRLGEELGRVPTDEEVDEWLRRPTEGY